MPVQAIEKQHATAKKCITEFNLALAAPGYDDIPAARSQLVEFIAQLPVAAAYGEQLSLTLSEILSNLVKHPEKKAGAVRIHAALEGAVLRMDIADDSTPFASFDAKCKAASAPMDCAFSMRESGYGLGCILKQHTGVTYFPAPESVDGHNHFIIREDVSAAATLPANKKIIFLVDDDPLVLKHQHRFLADLYDVVPFHRAHDAIHVFGEYQPDLIISDLNMPDMDGLAFRKKLSSLNGGNTTPFIFLSASADAVNSHRISELGVDDFICKPVSKDTLLSVVQRLLHRSQQVKSSLEGKFHEDLSGFLKPALPPQYGPWQIRTLSAMAEAGGGDFTLYQDNNDHLLAVLADVMGHGKQAKFFSYAYAGYLRSIFRTCAGTVDTAEFLMRLSKAVEDDDFLESIILTCQSFQFFRNGWASVASAGHPAPILLTAEGTRIIDVGGPLPGMSRGNRYRAAEFQLKPGERLIFASDGFFEAFDAEAHQRGNFISFLEQNRRSGLDDMTELIWRFFKQRTAMQTHPGDDATLIVAEYGGIS